MKTFRHFCKILLRDLHWRLRGKWLRNPALPVRPRKFLFVCKGNICRSPAAELLAKQVLGAGLPAAHLAFASAGLEVIISEKSPEEAVMAGEGLGLNLREHRSVKISAKLIKSSDMIFVMEVRQLRQLVRLFPNHRHRFFLLPLFGSSPAKGYGRYHIPDPYGKPVSEFSRCFQSIKECLLNLKTALAAVSTVEDLTGKDHGADLHSKVSNW